MTNGLQTDTINEKEQSLINLEENEKVYITELTQSTTKIQEYKKEIHKMKRKIQKIKSYL